MRLLAKILLTVSMLGWPSAALAAPDLVKGIDATFENGQVRVTWEAPASGDPVSSYRIYYSRASILQNRGEYEEFETVSGDKQEFILTDFPPARALFVSVLAVNAAEKESPFFAEEARVEIPASEATSGGNVPATQPLRLLRAESLSSTGVLLVFSATPAIDAGQAASALQISEGSGVILPITRFEIRDTRIFVTTQPQDDGKTYAVRVAPVVFGRSPFGERVPLDENGSSAFFTGTDAVPAAPTVIATPGSLSTALEDVRQLVLHPELDREGAWTVTASWQPAADASGIAGYRISLVRGPNIPPERVEAATADSRSIRLERLVSGPLQVVVQSVAPDGSVSRGAAESIMLSISPVGPVAPIAIPAGTTPLPIANEPTSFLSKSGPAATAVLVLSGAAIGWLWMRRRKRS
jgi:hypothetical protein